MNDSKKNIRFESLDGLRGIAALLVAYIHFHVQTRIFPTQVEESLYLMVDLFFVLSGFVLCVATNGYTKYSFFGFVLWRLKRLYPLHLFTLFIFIVIEVAYFCAQSNGFFEGSRQAFTEPRPLLGILTNLLLIHASGFFQGHGWNGPSWSVSAEFLANIAFFSLVVSMKLNRVVVLIVVIVLSFMVLCLYSPDYMHTELDYSVFRALYGMAFGYITWWVWNSFPNLCRRFSMLKVNTFQIFSFSVVAIFMFVAGTGAWSLLSPVVFAIFLYSLLIEGGGVTKILSFKLFTYLGAISYSIYLIHPILVTLIKYAIKLLPYDIAVEIEGGRFRIISFGGEMYDVIAIITYLGLLICISALSARYVERKTW
ncbi:acyltransferase family protein [Teredinibacter turnerae]|uniref:acyltransferase family protein n=1 Tax=Teredinibacter turnerae TaxID=2426 RepID=UPI000425D6C8|nr:acyltransferase [Teredinibacter turnerae]